MRLDNRQPSAAAEAVARLVAREEEPINKLALSHHEYSPYLDHQEKEPAVEGDAPVMTSFIQDLGPSAMTNFTESEFSLLWEQVEEKLLPERNLGRGRRHKTTAKDAFFMSLAVLKHHDSWLKHATDFRMLPPTFEKMINKASSYAAWDS
ncbi:hypothetical protein PHMEG_00019214 [Phytophthora megakarya]|uniref:Uncharacterized protein n=1 Tax=Phytophthora megakarya TaxID=4795 RepID=A0A225VSF6_9STRA|nr:hypothetical protein PHMEG_00019214 [Phytophthora megakarya]